MDSNVKNWMSGNPISVRPDAAALEAHDRMVESGIRHLPVVDDDNRVVGVLSIDDLRAALPVLLNVRAPLPAEDREVAREWSVGELMTHAPETLHADASLGEAADLMADRRIGCVPVVDDDGRLTGLLSETDALRALATAVWSEGLAKQRSPGGSHDSLVEELRRERDRITKRLVTLTQVERDLSEQIHDQPMDAPEAGADLREVELAGTLDELAARRIEAIDHALDHAARGQLTVCSRCSGRIPIPRLRAMPGTTLCVACARAEEPDRSRENRFERPPGGRAETGRAELGSRVYTRFGEGVLLRISPFGTCSHCGDVEGRWDQERDEAVCGNEGCGRPISDVRDRAIVSIEDREAYVDPAELRNVDPEPYD